MKTFSQYLNESTEIFYHGSNIKIDEFNLDNLSTGSGTDQEGPGIYLTNSPDDARHYGKYIHKVQVKFYKSKMMPEKRRFGADTIRHLIWKSPERDDALTNWDEYPSVALSKAVQSIVDSCGPNDYREAMEVIWYDFYRDHPREWLSKMRVAGWDGFILDRQGGVKHLIVFNPGILKVVEVKENIQESHETTSHPSVMYHGTSRENRESIKQHGLLRSEGEAYKMGGFGGVFLSTKPGTPSKFIDVWQVDVRGLHLEPDDTTIPEDEEDSWWVTYDEDIPPNRLKLLPAMQESYLQGSRQPLYHWTDLYGLMEILRWGAVGHGDDKTYDPIKGYSKLRHSWVSFTRDRNYAIRGRGHNGGVRLTFDWDRLRHHYKTEPYRGLVGSDNTGDNFLTGREARFEAEEVIFGPVKLSDGLIRIEVTQPVLDIIHTRITSYQKRLKECEEHLKRVEAGLPSEDEVRKHMLDRPNTSFTERDVQRIYQRFKNEPNFKTNWWNSDVIRRTVGHLTQEIKAYQDALQKVKLMKD